MKEDALKKLHEDGLLPEKHFSEWKAPGNHHVTDLKEGEIVMFTPFVERGLGLPTSNFFCGLLYYYDIRMNHLNPNSILQLSILSIFAKLSLESPFYPSVSLLLQTKIAP